MLVVNNRPGEHAAFETARERFRQSPQRTLCCVWFGWITVMVMVCVISCVGDHFVFVENNKADPDDASTDPGSANVPGARVRLPSARGHCIGARACGGRGLQVLGMRG